MPRVVVEPVCFVAFNTYFVTLEILSSSRNGLKTLLIKSPRANCTSCRCS